MLLTFLLLNVGTMMLSLPTGSAQEEEKPEYGGTFIFALGGDPPTLTGGIFSTARYTQHVTPKVYSGLTYHDEEQNPVPDLAESWDIAADGMTYTFHLVHNATFHDGVAVTSADVKFSWDEVFQPIGVYGATIGVHVDHVETPDDYTVVFKMKHPFSAIIKYFVCWVFPILPKHLWEGTDIPNNPYRNAPVGSGPFKFVEWVKGDHITYERYDNYFRTDKWGRRLPYLDKVVFKIFSDSTLMALAFERGEVDALSQDTPRSLVDTLLKASNATIYWTHGGWSAAKSIFFQVQRPIVSNKLVRHAIAYAINREELLEKAVFGQGRVNSTIGPPSTGMEFYWNPDQKKYEYDPAMAEQLLDQAGYPRPTPGGTRFKLKLVWRSTYPDETTAAEIITEQLKNVGIDLELVPADPATMIQIVFVEWDFDIAIVSPGIGPAPGVSMIRFYVSWNQRHVSYSNVGYNNTEVDALFDEFNQEVDMQKQREIMFDIVDVLAEDLPTYTIWEELFPLIYKSTYVNAVTTPWVNERQDETWYIAPEAAEEAAPIPWEIIIAVVIVVVVLAAVAFWAVRRRKT